MNPFYDENFFTDYNNYPNYYPLDKKERLKQNIKKSIHYTTRTIYTINQLIPIIYQLQPLINNTKNAIKIFKTIKQLDEIDLDEVEQSITTTSNQNNDDFIFENMIQ